MKLINAVLAAFLPSRAAKAKADSESLREGLKWLMGSRAFKGSWSTRDLPGVS